MGSRQIDEETSHDKTWEYLAGRLAKHIKKLSAQSHKEMGERKNRIGRSERATRHLVPDGDPACEKSMNNARRNLEIRRASAMLCKVSTPANPNGSNWATLCK